MGDALQDQQVRDAQLRGDIEPIPIGRGSYARTLSYTMALDPYNQDVNLPVVTVTANMVNWTEVRGSNRYESNWGRMMVASYPGALEHALKCYNFRPLEFFPRKSKVRAIFKDLVLYNSGERAYNDLDTKNAPVFVNNPQLTMDYMYFVMEKKYHNDYRGAAAEQQEGSFWNYVIDTTAPFEFSIEYNFLFAPVPGVRWNRLNQRRAYINGVNRVARRRVEDREVAAPPGGIGLGEQANRGRLIRNQANLGARIRNRVGGQAINIAGGSAKQAFTRLKKGIFIKKTLGDIFTHSKACKFVPESEGGFCFPMAFMMCERRVVSRKVEASGLIAPEICGIKEDVPTYLNLDPDTADEIPEFARKTYSFWNYSEKKIKLFDTTKHRENRAALYENEDSLPMEEKQTWVWCAIKIHEFVQYHWGVEPVNMNDLSACVRAYSYVFGVNIAVFAMECKGARIMCERVKTNSLLEEDHFIGMLLEGTHMNAISNMRDYQKSDLTDKRTCVAYYCDYCATFGWNRTKDYKHQTKCSTEEWEKIPSLEDIHIESITPKRKHSVIPHSTKPMCTACFMECTASGCQCPGGTPEMVRQVTFVKCNVCNIEVPRNHFNVHDCYMKPKKVKEPLAEEDIFVYDMESIQEYDPTIGQYVHETILVCLRAVYDDRRWHFKTIEAFVSFLMETKEMHKATLFAHNGGGYDVQFILRYLEDNGIPNETVPRPNTIHKYLSVKLKLKGGEITFLDFMMMMTDSLRNIGAAFKLDARKGDFPHNFSKRCHLDYVGPLPPLDHEADYYGFKTMKSQKELDEARDYWKKQGEKYCTCICNVVCNCTKPKWDFQKELLDYCWVDVDVLAGACKAYRDQALAFGGPESFDWAVAPIDPFNYMTQSQIALAMFTSGKKYNNMAITHERMRRGFNPNSIKWMEYEMSKNRNYKILHAGNYHREWYDIDSGCHVSGYCKTTRTVFEYHSCYFDACPVCYPEKIQSKEIHPLHGVTWETVMLFISKKRTSLEWNNVYNKVIHHWSHDDKKLDDFEWNDEWGKLMPLRSIFYGGRTEVFSAYCEPDKLPGDKVIEYDDVCSLYPYVCSYKELPIGIQDVYVGKYVDRSRLDPERSDRFFGFIRAKIIPNTNDLVGILPERIHGKLMYTVEPKVGVWHTEFIYLAMKKGYKVEEVYEVWDWVPSQRSDNIMRGYMEFFLRQKQEADGWEKLGQDLYDKALLKDDTRTEAMEETICNYIQECNGGFAKPRPEFVEKNPVKRQLAKIFLNCLWGKLSQKNPTEFEQHVHGYKQYMEIMLNPNIDDETIKFRHVRGGLYKSRFSLRDRLEETNKFINVPMAASVTAHAQIILMSQMFKVGPENVLYCDTDSVIYLKDKDGPCYTKSGLGNWADEYPGEKINKYLALAPKCYVLNLESEDVFKCKGVRTTEDNRKKTKTEELEKLVSNSFIEGSGQRAIQADTMIIHPNSTNAKVPYGTLLTRYGKKDIRTVYSKRSLVMNQDPEVKCLEDIALIRLTPFGYTGEHTHIKFNKDKDKVV